MFELLQPVAIAFISTVDKETEREYQLMVVIMILGTVERNTCLCQIQQAVRVPFISALRKKDIEDIELHITKQQEVVICSIILLYYFLG